MRMSECIGVKSIRSQLPINTHVPSNVPIINILNQ